MSSFLSSVQKQLKKQVNVWTRRLLWQVDWQFGGSCPTFELLCTSALPVFSLPIFSVSFWRCAPSSLASALWPLGFTLEFLSSLFLFVWLCLFLSMNLCFICSHTCSILMSLTLAVPFFSMCCGSREFPAEDQLSCNKFSLNSHSYLATTKSATCSFNYQPLPLSTFVLTMRLKDKGGRTPTFIWIGGTRNGSGQQWDYTSFTLPLTGKQFIFRCTIKRKVISKCNPSRPVANKPLKPPLHKPGGDWDECTVTRCCG